MGKWLAEFQENIPETHGSLTDKTDKSPLMSVMSVHDQGVLKEKTQNPELMARVSDACAGLDMTPEQLIRTLNSEGKEQIISGELSASKLKDYAKQIDDSIKDGVIELIAETAYQEAKP